jgi:hypothetical protein
MEESERIRNAPSVGGSPVYYSGFYPMQLALLTVADNLMPLAWWTPISKAPFRLILAIDEKNHSLNLIRTYREAALHFLPWAERERVVRAGYLSGRSGGTSNRGSPPPNGIRFDDRLFLRIMARQPIVTHPEEVRNDHQIR